MKKEKTRAEVLFKVSFLGTYLGGCFCFYPKNYPSGRCPLLVPSAVVTTGATRRCRDVATPAKHNFWAGSQEKGNIVSSREWYNIILLYIKYEPEACPKVVNSYCQMSAREPKQRVGPMGLGR